MASISVLHGYLMAFFHRSKPGARAAISVFSLFYFTFKMATFFFSLSRLLSSAGFKLRMCHGCSSNLITVSSPFLWLVALFYGYFNIQIPVFVSLYPGYNCTLCFYSADLVCRCTLQRSFFFYYNFFVECSRL